MCISRFDFGRFSSKNLNLCWFFLDIPAFRFIYVRLLILKATCLVQENVENLFFEKLKHEYKDSTEWTAIVVHFMASYVLPELTVQFYMPEDV